MKKLLFLFILPCLSIVYSCKKDTESVYQNNVITDKTEVKTFELIHIVAYQNLESKYSATFGSESVELIKTSDSTLAFMVPEVPSGSYTLKFELGSVSYKVSQTVAISADKLISDFSEKLDTQIESLAYLLPQETEKYKQFKKEVLTLFNSLSDEEKQKAASFYEANKNATQNFISHTFENLNGATSMRKQSDCPRTDFKAFYGCTASNLGNAAFELVNASKDVVELLALAGAAAILSPASLGLSAFGTITSLGAAGYLLLTEVMPAAGQFRSRASEFLSANWIFTKALFEVITEKFTNDVQTDMNLKPAFRSLEAEDKEVLPETGFFINAMNALGSFWDKLTAVFGRLPEYQKKEEPTTLSSKNITISGISNPAVQYVNNDGKSVRFKSMSDKNEEFSFDITVEKEGFTESAKVNAIINPMIDSTEIYEAAVIGQWSVEGPESHDIYDLTIEQDGMGFYYIKDGANSSDGKYPITWRVFKGNGGKYFFQEDGFWNDGYEYFRIFDISLPEIYLTYPVSSFLTYSSHGPNETYATRRYSKK